MRSSGKSKKKFSLSVIIPTYNDENIIISQCLTVERIVKKFTDDYEIIIADDHSSDTTPLLLKKFFGSRKTFRLIFNKQNLGITKNVMQLYTLAQKEVILFYSADGDWNPHDIQRLLNTKNKYNADIVIGKRVKKEGYTFYRHAISFLHRLLPLLLFQVDTIDPGGIKIFKKNIVRFPRTSSSQFFEAEMIIRAKKMRYKISWCPVTYKKTMKGVGHGGKFSSALHSFMDLLKLRINSM